MARAENFKDEVELVTVAESAAWGFLVTRMYDREYEEAQDLVQQATLVTWQRLCVDSELRHRTRVRRYTRAVADNLLVGYLRRKTSNPIELCQVVLDEAEDDRDDIESTDRCEYVHSLLDTVWDECSIEYQILMMKECIGLTLRQIALEVGLSKSRVHELYHAAIDRARRTLGTSCLEDASIFAQV